MWNGLEGLSDYSIGIELEGYHNIPFSEAQYSSLGKLLNELQEKYEIEDRNVLEHYRVAYAAPNHYHRSSQRGRKLDPGIDNFERARAGLGDEYRADPDVIAGRIDGSPELMRAGGHVLGTAETEEEEDPEESAAEESHRSAGAGPPGRLQVFDTMRRLRVYRFPDGRSYSGEQIKDWSDIPPGTRVELGVPVPEEKKVVSVARVEVVVPQVTATDSPWKIANALYNSSFTFYVLPDGRVQPGNTVKKIRGSLRRARKCWSPIVSFRSPRLATPWPKISRISTSTPAPCTCFRIEPCVPETRSRISTTSTLHPGVREGRMTPKNGRVETVIPGVCYSRESGTDRREPDLLACCYAL